MASLNQTYMPLGIKRIKQLLRRATFVYTKALIDQYSKLTLPKRWIYCWSIAHHIATAL
jgi:hypothetical protein